MFLTAELVFTIFMLAAEKHKGTFIAPVGIGLSLFIAELMGVYYTGGSLNPARSFGPCVVVGGFYSYHWIYWVGPILGALLASGFYLFIKALEYETVNPDAEDAGDVHMHFNPETGTEMKQSALHTSTNGQVSASNAEAGGLVHDDVTRGKNTSAGSDGTLPHGKETGTGRRVNDLEAGKGLPTY